MKNKVAEEGNVVIRRHRGTHNKGRDWRTYRKGHTFIKIMLIAIEEYKIGFSK